MSHYEEQAEEGLSRMFNNNELYHLHCEINGMQDRVEANEMMLRALKKEIDRGKKTLVALKDAYNLLDLEDRGTE